MTLCVTCNEVQPRSTLSSAITTMVAVITAMTFSASGAAPTSLYHQYQESFGLTPFAITIVFAAYVLSLLAALLTVGSLSDYIGRRPAILAALILNAVSMTMFTVADSAAVLIAARALQGFATGLATASLGAAILDNDRSRGPILNSITAFCGLSAGSLGGAILVTYAPDPRQLVYVALLVLSAVEAFILWYMPETAQLRAGALASLRPHISVPAQARDVLVRVTPVTIASWSLGGFYFSLMPALVRVATGLTLPVIGGLVVSALTLSGAITVLSLRSTLPGRMLSGGIVTLVPGVAITLAGVHEQMVWLMLIGTIISGTGFGAAFAGTMRTVLPLAKTDERAGLLAAFYVEGYLSFSLPAVLAGLAVPMVGLTVAAYVYGSAVIVMTLASMIAISCSRDWGSRPQRICKSQSKTARQQCGSCL
ncbi:MAG: MFS transporter [Xanthobacteraceae bacterium]